MTTKVINQREYEVGEIPLGEGRFSRVYPATRMDDGSLCAWKEYNGDPDPAKRKHFVQSALYTSQCSLKSPKVVSVLEYNLDEQKPVIVMERLDHTLAQEMDSWREKKSDFRNPDIRFRCYQHILNLLSGLQDLHQRGFYHGELTNENILLDETGNVLKLSDLVQEMDRQTTSMYSTGADIWIKQSYYPPVSESLSPSYDMFMASQIISELLTGSTPNSLGSGKMRNYFDRYKNDPNRKLSEKICEFLTDIHQAIEPSDRKSAQEALALFESEFKLENFVIKTSGSPPVYRVLTYSQDLENLAAQEFNPTTLNQFAEKFRTYNEKSVEASERAGLTKIFKETLEKNKGEQEQKERTVQLKIVQLQKEEEKWTKEKKENQNEAKLKYDKRIQEIENDYKPKIDSAKQATTQAQDKLVPIVEIITVINRHLKDISAS